MLPQVFSRKQARWQERYGSDGRGKSGSTRQASALREEIYQSDVTDRELLYGDSFSSKWARLSNYSPDDFE